MDSLCNLNQNTRQQKNGNTADSTYNVVHLKFMQEHEHILVPQNKSFKT